MEELPIHDAPLGFDGLDVGGGTCGSLDFFALFAGMTIWSFHRLR